MKAQTSLENLFVFVSILAILGLVISALMVLGAHSKIANAKTQAIAKSKECAAIVDALFANSGGKPQIVLPNCVPAGAHQIKVNDFNQEKNAFTIAHELSITIQNNQPVLEVKTPDHYE